MRPAGRTRRILGGLVAAAAIAVGCSGGSDDVSTDAADVVSTDSPGGSDFTPADGERGDSVNDGESGGGVVVADDDFDPAVVDDGLVASTVDEVVLDDDVIIATDDGQIPTTTSAPPPAPADTVPSDSVTTSPATTIVAAPLPEPSSIRRVVSLAPTHTETIAALGLADLLVGIDFESTVPDGATGVVRDLLAADDLDAGDLSSLDVDLVVLGEFGRDAALEVLAAAGIPAFDGSTPTTRAGVEQQILDLATALDREALGVEFVASMRAEVDDILASIPTPTGLTYFHEIDPGLATYTPGTLVDSLYAELGLTSIVPAADDDVTFLASDALVAADPDVVVLGDIDCCAATADRAAARPGWADLSAVRSGAIVEVPDDVANRWGTNIVDLMRLVSSAVIAAS